MFFFKEKKIFFLLFFIILNISCFNIKWLEMNQSLENEETFVIKCEYDTENEYILAESLQANTFPAKQ